MSYDKVKSFEVDCEIAGQKPAWEKLLEGQPAAVAATGTEKNRFSVRLFAIMMYSLSAVAVALTALLWKIAFFYNPNLNGYDYMLIRWFATVASSSLTAWKNKVNVLDVKSKYRFSFFWIIVFNCVGMVCFFIGLKVIPSAKASLAYSTYPIFVSILGFLILKESMSKYQVFCTLGAFVGVAFLLLSKAESSENIPYLTQVIGMLLCFVTCADSAVTIVYLRYFHKENSYLLFPFYYAVGLTSFSILLLVFYPAVYNFKYYDLQWVLLFTASGVMNIVVGVLSCYALSLEEASILAPYGYVAPLVAFLFDIFFFQYTFGYLGLLGGLMTVFFLLIKLREKKETQTDKKEDS